MCSAMLARISSAEYAVWQRKRNSGNPASAAALFLVASRSCCRCPLCDESSSSTATSGSNVSGAQITQSKCFWEMRENSPFVREHGSTTSATRTLGKISASGSAARNAAKNCRSAGERSAVSLRNFGPEVVTVFFFVRSAANAVAITTSMITMRNSVVTCGAARALGQLVVVCLLRRVLQSLQRLTVWKAQDARRVLWRSFATRSSSFDIAGEPCPYHQRIIPARYSASLFPTLLLRDRTSAAMCSGSETVNRCFSDMSKKSQN